MSIKGLPSSDLILKKDGAKQEYVTVQKVGSKRHALDVIVNTTYDVSTVPVALDVLPAVQTDRSIFSTGHGAREGQRIRFSGGTLLDGFVAPIIRVTANEIFFGVILPELPVEGTHTFIIQDGAALRSDSSGNLTLNQGPVQYVLDTVDTQVNEDTAVPANNRPLPSKSFYDEDGVNTPVSLDTVTPANSKPMPVQIISTAGTPATFNITTGDIGVHITHDGNATALFDSTRLGDGTTLVGVTLSNELQVFDGGANTLLTSIAAEDFATETTLAALNTKVSVGQLANAASIAVSLSTEQEALLTSIDGKDFATQTTLEALRVAFVAEDFATETTLAAINTKTPALGQALMAASVPVAIASDQSTLPISIASQPLPTGAATEVTLAALDAKFSSLGQKASASSAPVVLSTEQEAILTSIDGKDFATETTLAAQSAKLPASLGSKTSATSFSVTLASDEADIGVRETKPNGAIAGSTSAAVITTLSAPANAQKLFFQADSTNGFSVRLGLAGSVPTTSTGYEILPGASIEIEISSDIQWIPESGTQKINYFWTTRS